MLLVHQISKFKMCLKSIWEFLRYALRLHLLFSLFGDKSNTSMDMSGSGRITPLPNLLVHLLSYNLVAAAGTEPKRYPSGAHIRLLSNKIGHKVHLKSSYLLSHASSHASMLHQAASLMYCLWRYVGTVNLRHQPVRRLAMSVLHRGTSNYISELGLCRASNLFFSRLLCLQCRAKLSIGRWLLNKARRALRPQKFLPVTVIAQGLSFYR